MMAENLKRFMDRPPILVIYQKLAVKSAFIWDFRMRSLSLDKTSL